MSLRIKATDVAAVQGRQLFFDANVLFYLFGNGASRHWANAYNSIFRQCLSMKNELCVDVFVLSEFINRFLRSEHENYLKTNNLDKNTFNFKCFRSNSTGIQVAQDIELVVKGRILKHFEVIGKSFNKLDITSINLVNTDFNDELIVKTCEEHQCVLVTNDADFSSAKIDILSANHKLN